MIESPCISICVLDDEQMCLGCYRTLDEIGVWSNATEEQRQNIIDAAVQRKENDC